MIFHLKLCLTFNFKEIKEMVEEKEEVGFAYIICWGFQVME